jgi:hypothetical protein
VPDKDVWSDELGFTDLGTEKREEKIEEIKTLIRELGQRYPEVFEEEDISAGDYKRELKDAIFSLGGVLRQEHGSENEDTVERIFLQPASDSDLLAYEDQRGEERIDFKGTLTQTGEDFAMDVKGGEGQSIGHLLVPNDTDTLVVWSERSSRNTKSPAQRLNEVINRSVRWGLNHSEDVTLMVNRDEPAGARTDEGDVIPDVILFPEHFPDPQTPEPSMQDPANLEFLRILYDTLIGKSDLSDEEIQKHIWLHELQVSQENNQYVVDKEIYNYYDNSITLSNRRIDYSRTS